MTYHLNFNFIWRYADKLWWGLALSLELAFVSILICCVIGFALAVVHTGRSRILRIIVSAYVEFIRNLYLILADLRKKHPKIEIESCSGGGGRVDLGILRYTDEVWPSDNTDPFDRLSMQDGFTYAYTPQIMMAWVTDSPHWLDNKRATSLVYRMLSSMQGSLGIGANLNN